MDKDIWKTALAVWGSTALAVSVGIYFTNDMRCLWFMIIPMLMRIKSDDSKEDKS